VTKQCKEAYEKQTALVQLEAICKHLEVITLENKSYRAHSKQSEARLEFAITELTKERDSLHYELTRLKHEARTAADLRSSLNEFEGQYHNLEFELKSVQRQLKSKEQSIERLENELTKETKEEFTACEALKQVKKENVQLKFELKTLKADYEASEANVEELRMQLSASFREQRLAKSDLERRTDEIQVLIEELEIYRETVKELKERIGLIKDDFTRQLVEKVKALQLERETEDRMTDFHDETSDTKSLFEHSSLHDEMAELVDFRPVKLSSLFNSFQEYRQLETLKAELAQKQSVIESVTRARDELQANLNKVNKHLFKVMRQLTNTELSKEEEVSQCLEMMHELRGEIDSISEQIVQQGCEESLAKLGLSDSEIKETEESLGYSEASSDLEALRLKLTAM
jgi:chromosome segregation protein